MRLHLRVVAILAVGVIAYFVLLQAFRLISAPSDRSLYGGITMLFVLLLAVPAVVREIWRRR
jgi:hypothetical protein